VRKSAFTSADIELYKEALSWPGALSGAVNYYRANVGRMMLRRKAKPAGKPNARRRETKAHQDEPEADLRFGCQPIHNGEKDFAIIPKTVSGIGDYMAAPYHELRIADSGHWVQNEAPRRLTRRCSSF
jgi:hypothetical protein